MELRVTFSRLLHWVIKKRGVSAAETAWRNMELKIGFGAINVRFHSVLRESHQPNQREQNTSPLTNPHAPELGSYYPSGIVIVPNQIEVISLN
jgi:hypothetical protein